MLWIKLTVFDMEYIIMKKMKKIILTAAVAMFACAVFALAGSVSVKAYSSYDLPTGNYKLSEFRDEDSSIYVDDGANVTLTIDKSKRMQSLFVGRGSTLTIKGTGNNTLTLTENVNGYNNQSTLIINGGNVKTKYINWRFNKVTIAGGNVELDAGNDCGAIEIFNGDICISGGTVTARSTANGWWYGIYADGNVIISGGKVTATGTNYGLYGNIINIKGKSTVVNASGSGAAVRAYDDHGESGTLTVEKPLEVVEPEGGGISGDGRIIATVEGGDVPAVEVVIKNGSPEEPAATATTEKAIGRYDSKDDDDTVQEYTKAAPVNKDALVITKMSGFPAGTFFAKQEQGIAAKNAFLGALPAGYKSAFTFNVITNGVSADYSLKNGSFTLLIPEEYRKSGRTFAISCIDKSGNVRILYDTDTDPNTISVDVNFEGFAFDLIYKD